MESRFQQGLAQGNAAHERNAESGGGEPDRACDRKVAAGDAGHVQGSDPERGGVEQVGDDIADQRCKPHRRKARDRIAADDELERIECPGQRCPERAGDRPRCSASDQDPQIPAPQVKAAADPGGYPARQLRVAGLHPDRGSDSARPHGLQRDVDAADERHAPAVQRVGLDWINLPRWPPARQGQQPQAEGQPPERWDRHRAVRIERGERGQPFAGQYGEEKPMKLTDPEAHDCDDEARQCPDDPGEQYQTQFPRAHQGS